MNSYCKVASILTNITAVIITIRTSTTIKTRWLHYLQSMSKAAYWTIGFKPCTAAVHLSRVAWSSARGLNDTATLSVRYVMRRMPCLPDSVARDRSANSVVTSRRPTTPSLSTGGGYPPTATHRMWQGWFSTDRIVLESPAPLELPTS